ncbi:hypothetical protein DV702_10915 [Sporosarcina sp. PTS2304]|uniref:hypothetical protein n=1 Tax=Sporosarcina sp. PTS2304 TaxID=2283194 RepID=UPI000E0DAE9D|nr:hypothetical protein [Sporosarcina sp. PTS2304]AXI00186.1 hypothetical protein DV702_10915 [Sporosarcina sp. PTS2304]
MKKKIKQITFLATISLLAGGCSMPIVEGENVVINEDVKSESALADGSLTVKKEKDIKVWREISNEPYHQPVTGETITYNENGALYLMDLLKGTKEKVAEREAFTVSENGKWALSFENEEGELYVHNLENGKMNILENASPDDTQFVDNEVFYRYFTTQTIVRVDPEKDIKETWDMSLFENYSLAYLTKYDDQLYIAGENKKGEHGIYQLLEDGVVKIVLNLPGTHNDINDFSMLADGSVLFQGTMNEKDGIFYWNKQQEQVTKLLSGGEDQEGKWINFYNLSPDQTKILYDMPVQVGDVYKSDIYIAELVDGKLTNDTRIMENAELYGVISLSGGWSLDSKTVYIKTMESIEWNDSVEIPEECVGSIEVFKVEA